MIFRNAINNTVPKYKRLHTDNINLTTIKIHTKLRHMLMHKLTIQFKQKTYVSR